MAIGLERSFMNQSWQKSLAELEKLGLVLTTNVSTLKEKWERAHFSSSFFPLNLGTGCCGLEMMHASLGTDLEITFDDYCVRNTPEESDLLIVSGAINHKMVPILKNIYEQMLAPKWVMAVGTCAASGAVFSSYATVAGLDKILPVDVVVPGCPPTAQALMSGVDLLKERIEKNAQRVIHE